MNTQTTLTSTNIRDPGDIRDPGTNTRITPGDICDQGTNTRTTPTRDSSKIRDPDTRISKGYHGMTWFGGQEESRGNCNYQHNSSLHKGFIFIIMHCTLNVYITPSLISYIGEKGVPKSPRPSKDRSLQSFSFISSIKEKEALIYTDKV
jgi:hypothetical protein